MDLNNVAWACFKFIILHNWPSIVFFILLTIVSKIYKFKSSWKSLYEEYVHFKPFPRPTLGLQIYKCSTIYSQSIKFSKKYCRIFTPYQVKSTFSMPGPLPLPLKSLKSLPVLLDSLIELFSVLLIDLFRIIDRSFNPLLICAAKTQQLLNGGLFEHSLGENYHLRNIYTREDHWCKCKTFF